MNEPRFLELRTVTGGQVALHLDTIVSIQPAALSVGARRTNICFTNEEMEREIIEVSQPYETVLHRLSRCGLIVNIDTEN